ncbi:MAG: hypothetical protein KAQ79_10600 [Cyclobacteriaceae bacterium]|nr:hypothetical protein [Cyclobacteriaceae bacterium]
MKKGKTLLLIDSLINLLLGIILLAYSKPVVDLFGLPETDLKFYPNLLGAVLFGIGIALFIEYKRKEEFIGLGLGGAISINLIGGFVLFIWLISGNLILPIHGKIILWILDFILVAISFFELFVYLKNKRPTTKARL